MQNSTNVPAQSITVDEDDERDPDPMDADNDDDEGFVEPGATPSTHVVSPFYDYVYRPFALESLCWYEFVMQYERQLRSRRISSILTEALLFKQQLSMLQRSGTGTSSTDSILRSFNRTEMDEGTTTGAAGTDEAISPSASGAAATAARCTFEAVTKRRV
jgi:hypothetical protein